MFVKTVNIDTYVMTADPGLMDLLGTSMQSLHDVPIIHTPVNGVVLRAHFSISNKRVQI